MMGTQLLEDGAQYLNKYERKQQLGKGAFGVVYQVQDQSTGDVYAAKHIRARRGDQLDKVKEEIRLMRMLDNDHVIRLISAYQQKNEIILVMEYLDGGELFDRVSNEEFNLTESECVIFLRQICKGMAYIHSFNIVHLDLKPENIVCVNRNETAIKIIDFGIAKQIDPDTEVKVMCGTPEFMAPEVVNFERISTATDMWAVGVICYILISGLSPFLGDNNNETHSNVMRCCVDFEDEEFNEISKHAKDFIGKLLMKDPKQRLTAEDCLTDPWLVKRDKQRYRTRIKTVNLRKFVARRRWQRCGQAVIAITKMTGIIRRKSTNSISDSSFDNILSPLSPSKSNDSLLEVFDEGDDVQDNDSLPELKDLESSMGDVIFQTNPSKANESWRVGNLTHTNEDESDEEAKSSSHLRPSNANLSHEAYIELPPGSPSSQTASLFIYVPDSSSQSKNSSGRMSWENTSSPSRNSSVASRNSSEVGVSPDGPNNEFGADETATGEDKKNKLTKQFSVVCDDYDPDDLHSNTFTSRLSSHKHLDNESSDNMSHHSDSELSDRCWKEAPSCHGNGDENVCDTDTLNGTVFSEDAEHTVEESEAEEKNQSPGSNTEDSSSNTEEEDTGGENTPVDISVDNKPTPVSLNRSPTIDRLAHKWQRRSSRPVRGRVGKLLSDFQHLEDGSTQSRVNPPARPPPITRPINRPPPPARPQTPSRLASTEPPSASAGQPTATSGGRGHSSGTRRHILPTLREEGSAQLNKLSSKLKNMKEEFHADCETDNGSHGIRSKLAAGRKHVRNMTKPLPGTVSSMISKFNHSTD